jgi:hypothetical protein
MVSLVAKYFVSKEKGKKESRLLLWKVLKKQVFQGNLKGLSLLF